MNACDMHDPGLCYGLRAQLKPDQSHRRRPQTLLKTVEGLTADRPRRKRWTAPRRGC